VHGFFPNALYKVSGFSLPPIKTDRHHIAEKLLSMAKDDKQKLPVYTEYILSRHYQQNMSSFYTSINFIATISTLFIEPKPF
jgi:hypothetical protein